MQIGQFTRLRFSTLAVTPAREGKLESPGQRAGGRRQNDQEKQMDLGAHGGRRYVLPLGAGC